MNYQIENYKSRYKDEVIAVWEKSVLATHHFLDPKDFAEIKEILRNFDFAALNVFCLTESNKVIGFIALQDSKIEMLFLDPGYINRGFGFKLMNFAISNFRVNKVDVNEQNTEAKKFYEKLGFETFETTEKDDLGKNYPLLRMKLKKQE